MLTGTVGGGSSSKREKISQSKVPHGFRMYVNQCLRLFCPYLSPRQIWITITVTTTDIRSDVWSSLCDQYTYTNIFICDYTFSLVAKASWYSSICWWFFILVTQESLLDLYNKLSRKTSTDYYGQRVGPGWLKYEYNDAIWALDDGQPL